MASTDLPLNLLNNFNTLSVCTVQVEK